jgi:LemA protein
MLVGVGAGVLTLLALVVVLRMYNRLVLERNGVDNAFATIDVQLELRCDPIPKLVDAVRGYMTHERGVLDSLTGLRERASASGVAPETRLALDTQMASLLRGLVARVEAYPQLKANETVLMLQRSLNEVEAQIAAARRTYNTAVTMYNTSRETAPANLVAGLFGFRRRTLFEASSDDRAVPGVGGLSS